MKKFLFLAILSAIGSVFAETITITPSTASWQIKQGFCAVNDGVLKITGQPGKKNNTWLAVSVPLKIANPAEKKIKISADIKTQITAGTKGSFKFWVRFVNEKKESITYKGVAINKTQDWTPATDVVTVDKKAKSVELYMIATNMDADSFGEIKNVKWEVVK